MLEGLTEVREKGWGMPQAERVMSVGWVGRWRSEPVKGGEGGIHPHLIP